ncbi:hypothetical protein [Leucobacter sp. G161]|uniref:hypothetical protein n=1 Tax=Leucobacter sp. G161 TaxID=663704 RepID=UPI00073CB4C9|nr:hypothetical protein [Leucobacter sp. G161]KUF05534.1 hypothetical protein AUL38_04050 [Leucobacter sp. G161]
MAKLIYNFGVHGDSTTLEGVDDVREMSEVWETEGVDVVSVKVDMLDGTVKSFSPIRADYILVR